MHGKKSGSFSTSQGSDSETLTNLLDRRAEQFPDRVAFAYEDETGSTEKWTYRELRGRSLAVAAWLSKHPAFAQRTAAGERALLVYPPGLDFVASFFGCLYAAVLPVPATYPKPRRPLPRADAITRDCQPKLVLTHSSVLTGLNFKEKSSALANLTWEATDVLDKTLPKDFIPAKIAADQLAFLQYTSGSTSDPRGVMVSHQNILHNLESIRCGFQIAPAEQSARATAGVFWLPAYHDMGLIGGILCPLYVGGTSHLLAPTTFLRRPRRWLELMSETQAEISGAPNFGYELAVQKTTPLERAQLDLQHWRLAFCGAEPINSDTLHDFATAFTSAGFHSRAYYPCYGMAEVTLLVTGGNGPAEPKVLHIDRTQLTNHQVDPVEPTDAKAQAVVSCGGSFDGQTLKIVEPQARQVLPEGRVGEIWVRGGSVACGYWNQEDLNQETFRATLATGETEEFLRTGDLGFCWEGELFVTGRLKDIIIIRGRNYYPQDIERTAQQAHPAVDQGAAFSIEGDRQEQLVVVHQIRREFRKADMDEVLRAIRTAIVNEHELDPQQITLIRPVSLPITSSGKVQRNRCRGQFLAGELSVIADWKAPVCTEPTDWKSTDGQSSNEQLDGLGGDGLVGESKTVEPAFLEKLPSVSPQQLTEELQTWLISWLTQRAHLSPGAMQPATPFAELGIDSLSAVEISQDLDQVLGLELPPMVIWSCPSAEALAAYLAEQLLLGSKNSSPSGPLPSRLKAAPVVVEKP